MRQSLSTAALVTLAGLASFIFFDWVEKKRASMAVKNEGPVCLVMPDTEAFWKRLEANMRRMEEMERARPCHCPQ